MKKITNKRIIRQLRSFSNIFFKIKIVKQYEDEHFKTNEDVLRLKKTKIYIK